MAKMVGVYVLAAKEADATEVCRGLFLGRPMDVQISRAGQRLIVSSMTDSLGRISSSAQYCFDALLAAGDLAWADNPDLPALNTDSEGGDPRGLEYSLRAFGV